MREELRKEIKDMLDTLGMVDVDLKSSYKNKVIDDILNSVEEEKMLLIKTREELRKEIKDMLETLEIVDTNLKESYKNKVIDDILNLVEEKINRA